MKKKESSKISVLIVGIILGLFIFLSCVNIVINSYQDRAPKEIADLFSYKTESMGEGYTLNEDSHMRDVRTVLLWLKIIWLLTFFWFIIGVSNICGKIRDIARIAIYTNFVIIGVLVLMAIFFDQAFVLFHEIVFPGGNWTFPGNSKLLSHFPESFFVHELKMIIGSVIIALITLRMLNFEKIKKK